MENVQQQIQQPYQRKRAKILSQTEPLVKTAQSKTLDAMFGMFDDEKGGGDLSEFAQQKFVVEEFMQNNVDQLQNSERNEGIVKLLCNYGTVLAGKTSAHSYRSALETDLIVFETTVALDADFI